MDYTDEFKAGVSYGRSLEKKLNPHDIDSLASVYFSLSLLQQDRFKKKIAKRPRK